MANSFADFLPKYYITYFLVVFSIKSRLIFWSILLSKISQTPFKGYIVYKTTSKFSSFRDIANFSTDQNGILQKKRNTIICYI